MVGLLLIYSQLALGQASVSGQLESQRARYATVNVSAERLDRWIHQFPKAYREPALDLLADVELFDYLRFTGGLRELHRKVAERTVCAGLTMDRVDYTKPYTARSGDLVAFFYRRVNLVPSARITPTELLPSPPGGRALVILDDYVGSFAQILGEYYRRHQDTLRRYERIFVVTLAAHPVGRENLTRLQRGDAAGVADDITRLFQIDAVGATRVREGLANVDARKIEMIYLHDDQPFDRAKHRAIFDFLRARVRFGRSFQAPFGVADLASRVAFFYGPPNGAPDALWNTLGRTATGPFLPLFTRTEDISHYDFAAGLDEGDVVWGER